MKKEEFINIKHPIDDYMVSRPSVMALRQQLLEIIPRKPSNQATYEALQNYSMNRLIHVYINWTDRLIPPRKRKVMVWDGFWKRNDPVQYSSELNKIIELSYQGKNLNKYLSYKAHTDGFILKPIKKRGIFWGDKDMALNAHEIHHLHLKEFNDSGKRPGESKDLLFVGVSKSEILLLMLGNHKSFDDGTLFEAITEHGTSSNRVVNGVLAPRNPPTAFESQSLVRHGISSMGFSGETTVANSFISTAGTSVWHTRHADKCCIAIEEIEPHLNNQKSLADFFSLPIDAIPKNPEWQWLFWYCDLILHDKKSDKPFLIQQWSR